MWVKGEEGRVMKRMQGRDMRYAERERERETAGEGEGGNEKERIIKRYND